MKDWAICLVIALEPLFQRLPLLFQPTNQERQYLLIAIRSRGRKPDSEEHKQAKEAKGQKIKLNFLNYYDRLFYLTLKCNQ